MGMSTKTLPVTAASFEKVFAAIAPKRTIRRRSRAGKIAKDLAGWREIALAASKNAGARRACVESLAKPR